MLNAAHSNSPASLLRYSICRQNLVLFVKGQFITSLSCVQDSCSSLMMLILNVASQPSDLHRNISFLQFCSMMLMARLWTRTSPVTQQLAKIVTFRLNWELPVCSAYGRLCLHVWSVVCDAARLTAVIKSQTAIRNTFKCCHPEQISIFSHYCVCVSETHTQILLFFP